MKHANAMEQIADISQLYPCISNAMNMCTPPDTAVQGANLRVYVRNQRPDDTAQRYQRRLETLKPISASPWSLMHQ